MLEEQLRQTRDRFNVGEVTRTDVAQAEARLAGVALAGKPRRGEPAHQHRPVPPGHRRRAAAARARAAARPARSAQSLDAALKIAFNEHPAIIASLHGVDAAELQVKITQGELAPSLGVARLGLPSASTRQLPGDDSLSGHDRRAADGADLRGRRGLCPHPSGQRDRRAAAARGRFDPRSGPRRVDLVLGPARSGRAQIIAAQAQVAGRRDALNGVREEARVGQRTTLDVLNAQQELLNARVNLITAQRDRVVASYAVVQATGRLSSRSLGLKVAHYSARVHFDQVKDLWGGLTTPDGR